MKKATAIIMENPETQARLDEIAESIAGTAAVVEGVIDRFREGRMDLEQAQSVTRSAEVLVRLWELEADILRGLARA